MSSDHMDAWGTGEWGTRHRGRGETPTLRGGLAFGGGTCISSFPLCLRPSCPPQGRGSCKGICAPDLGGAPWSPGWPSAFTRGSRGAPGWLVQPLTHRSPLPPWPLGCPTKPRWTVPAPSRLTRGPSNLRAELRVAAARPRSRARPAAPPPCLFSGLPTAAWKLRSQTLGRGPWHRPRVTGTPVFAKKRL